MGQAKLRGTRDQRVAVAVAKEAARQEAVERERADRWAKMSQPEKDKALRIAGNEVHLITHGVSPEIAHFLATMTEEAKP